MRSTHRAAPLLAAFFFLAPAARAQVGFEKDVLPILRQSCFKCHADTGTRKKAKGGLRLDGREWIEKGGKNGRVVAAGKSDQSPLYLRVTLGADHEDVMPAKGDLLSEREADTIRRWIDGGAAFGSWTGEKVEVARTSGSADDVPPRVRVLMELGEELAPVDAEALRDAAGETAQITPAIAGSPLVRVQYLSNEERVDDKELARLAPIAGNVTQLLLGRTRVTDAGLPTVAAMARLTHLDLNRTRVTDGGIARLALLPELRVLNLFGTKVTDEGLAAVASLPKLERLYVWDTGVTAEGVERLREARPELAVHFERDLPKPQTGGDGGRGRRR